MAILFAGALVPTAVAAQTPPFGSAAAIADFNADGRPDTAVADRAAGADGSNYSIIVWLSNGRGESVSFASTLRALTVRALDVDNDQDLDLVVMPVLGHDVVGVWLNDGAGHFHRGDPDAVPADILRLSAGTMSGSPPQFAVATSTSRRRAAAARTSAVAVVFLSEAARGRPATIAAPARLPVYTLSPRAPPAATL